MESAEMGYMDSQTALGQLFELREEFETAKRWYIPEFHFSSSKPQV
jgi:hypothetical protein